MRFLTVELKRVNIAYEELVIWLEALRLLKTKALIANKIDRQTISATFLLTTIAALKMNGIKLEAL